MARIPAKTGKKTFVTSIDVGISSSLFVIAKVDLVRYSRGIILPSNIGIGSVILPRGKIAKPTYTPQNIIAISAL